MGMVALRPVESGHRRGDADNQRSYYELNTLSSKLDEHLLLFSFSL